MRTDGSVRRSQSGFTLVELLVTMAVGGIVMAIVGTFFVTQSRISTDLQDRNELNIRLRSVAEGVAQDLQLAGAEAVVDGDGPRYVPNVEGDCGAVHVTCAATPIDDLVVSVFYASSLRPQLAGTGDVCRNVVFQFDPDTGVLHRSDEECGIAPDTPAFPTEFAADISSIDLEFQCTRADATGAAVFVTDPSGCDALGGTRAATITVAGTTRRAPDRTGSVELTVTMPNTRMD